AEEDRDDLALRRQLGLTVEVGEQRGGPGGGVDLVADMAVEVAIRAFRPAERPVDVDGERLGLGHCCRMPAYCDGKSAAASLVKARERWSIRYFSAGSISPKVISWPSGMKIGS